MTISHTAPPLDDARIVVARRALAELPEPGDNERPYYWVGRLRVLVAALVTAWPSGVPGGLDNGQREVLAFALADAISHAPSTRTVSAPTRLRGHSLVQAQSGTINFHGSLDPGSRAVFRNTDGATATLTRPCCAARAPRTWT
jgi:hypothetical protein